MTATLVDERTAAYPDDALEGNVFIGTWPITAQGSGIPCGPSHVLIETTTGKEHYRYEQYQAYTLWGLRKMNRREIAAWRIKKALRRSA